MRWAGPSGSRAGRRTAARTRRRRGTGRRAPTRTSPRRRGSRSSGWPDSSSAPRIAPTCPSIIPDGAITSAPALGLRDRDRRVALEGRVVVDLAGVGEQAAVAVVGVLVEAVVGHQHERVADLVAQVAQRDLHHAVGVVGAANRGRPWWSGTPKRITAGHAEVGERVHLLAQALLRVLHDARHRHDRLGRVDALLHEQRRDEVVDARGGLRRPGAAARGCGAAGASAVRGTSRLDGTGQRLASSVRCRAGDRERGEEGGRRGRRWCGRSASASTRRPRPRAVSEVTGPIDTTSGCGSGSGPTTAQKLSTVDDDVNVIASTSPARTRATTRGVGRGRHRAVHRQHVDRVARARRDRRAARRAPARPGRAAPARRAPPASGNASSSDSATKRSGTRSARMPRARERARGAGTDRGDPHAGERAGVEPGGGEAAVEERVARRSPT